jgi:hypothetical protein
MIGVEESPSRGGTGCDHEYDDERERPDDKETSSAFSSTFSSSDSPVDTAQGTDDVSKATRTSGHKDDPATDIVTVCAVNPGS